MRTRSASKRVNDASQMEPPWESMSFACGGWLQFYLYGVARALQARGMDFANRVTYCGCSAGALAAVGLTLEGDFDAAVQFCKDECIPQTYQSVSGLFRLGDYVSRCIDNLVMPIYRQIPPGKLQLATTRLWPPLQPERISDFADEHDLKQSLMCSIACFPAAPLVCRSDRWYIDGGLSDFQPVMDENTITVSPFYFSDCDIKPSRYVPMWWCCLPPKSPATIDWLYALGWKDCMDFLEKKGLGVGPNPKSHLKELKYDISHPYHATGSVSINRVLGYDLSEITNEYFSFFLDFILLVLFLLLLKPVALLMIYTELLFHIIVTVASMVFVGITDIMLFIFICAVKTPDWSTFFVVFGTLVTYNTIVLQKKAEIIQGAGKIFSCLKCIFSLSLLLRFFSYRPSSVELRKHDILARLSILYRIFRHTI